MIGYLLHFLILGLASNPEPRLLAIEPLLDTTSPPSLFGEAPTAEVSTPNPAASKDEPPQVAPALESWTPDELMIAEENEPVTPELIPDPIPLLTEASPTTDARAPLSVPPAKSLGEHPAASEVAVILANDQFYPRKIRLRAGVPTRLIFTTINRKPAALIMEKLQLQRWIAKESEPAGNSELERAKWEVNRELSSNKITEILWEPRRGRYQFHDALSGAKGEIQVD